MRLGSAEADARQGWWWWLRRGTREKREEAEERNLTLRMTLCSCRATRRNGGRSRDQSRDARDWDRGRQRDGQPGRDGSERAGRMRCCWVISRRSITSVGVRVLLAW